MGIITLALFSAGVIPTHRRPDLGDHRVGHGAVPGDGRRRLADHADDGPAGRRAGAGPRLRRRDDRGHDPARRRPSSGMPVSTTHVISSAIMGVGSSQGVRRASAGASPGASCRLGPHHPGRRPSSRRCVGRPERDRPVMTVTQRRTIPTVHARRHPDELSTAAQGRPSSSTCSSPTARTSRAAADAAPRDGRRSTTARRAGRRDPGAREARRRDRPGGHPASSRTRSSRRSTGRTSTSCGHASTTSSTASRSIAETFVIYGVEQPTEEAKRPRRDPRGQGVELLGGPRASSTGSRASSPLRGDPRPRARGRRRSREPPWPACSATPRPDRSHQVARPLQRARERHRCRRGCRRGHRADVPQGDLRR